MASVQEVYDWRYEVLPPLPKPDYVAQRQEAWLGCAVVFGIMSILVGATNAMAFFVKDMPADARWLLSILIWCEAAMALVCHAGIHFVDPGVVRRSPSQSLPFPPNIEEAAKQGKDFWRQRIFSNFKADDGTSYCVRCYVWRQPRSHHCSTCAVCVSNFDHHCSIFGRCIAGRGLRGNLKYYRGILVCFVCGGITCSVCMFWGFFLAMGWLGIFPVLVLVFALACGFCYLCQNPFILADLAQHWRHCVTSFLVWRARKPKAAVKAPLLAADQAPAETKPERDAPPRSTMRDREDPPRMADAMLLTGL